MMPIHPEPPHQHLQIFDLMPACADKSKIMSHASARHRRAHGKAEEIPEAA
jgi:hypothetical protein